MTRDQSIPGAVASASRNWGGRGREGHARPTDTGEEEPETVGDVLGGRGSHGGSIRVDLGDQTVSAELRHGREVGHVRHARSGMKTTKNT